MDGEIDLKFEGDMAGNPMQKDIYVEVDWLPGHKPNDAAIQAVIDSFENKGITLHVLLDDEIPLHYDLIPMYFDILYPDYIPSFFTLKIQRSINKSASAAILISAISSLDRFLKKDKTF